MCASTTTNPDPAEEWQIQFTRLLTEHHRRLLGYIVSLVGNRPDAEDVLQRASITMWRKFATFDLTTDFMAWASTVAFYEARNFLRHAGRSQIPFDDTLLDLLARERRVDLARQMPRIEAMRRCLDELDEPSRELVQAAYLDEGSLVELADRLQRAPQTLYNKLNTIRRLLADCVERRIAKEGNP